MKLQYFNGGLNIRKAPELIAVNEAIICKNVDTTTGQLKSSKGLSQASITSIDRPYYFETESKWFANADTRDYLEYQGKIYYTDGITPKKVYSGYTQDLGITGPIVAPTLTGGTAHIADVTDTVQYVYTYYNTTDGTESEPSPISDEIDMYTDLAEGLDTSTSVHVNIVASTDSQVTNIILYRIGGTFLSFNKVVELSNTTTEYLDYIAAADLAIVTLTSSYNGKPPAGLKYLTAAYSGFLGAVGPKLYFTDDSGNPNYWPETNYINFHATIIGIGVISTGIVVFTYYQTYLLSGTSSNTFVKYIISGTQGCINHKTIKFNGETLVFISTDGICSITNNKVEVVSKFKLGKQTYSTINAVVHDEVYYCQLLDGSLICLDLRYEPSIKTFDFSSLWLVVAEDKLYAQTVDGLYEMFAGSDVTYEYSTGNMSDSVTIAKNGTSVSTALSEIKLYNDIYVYASGSHTMTIYINEVQVAIRTITGSVTPIQINVPQEYQMGSSIRFYLTGKGTIKEIEYKPLKRDNGR